MTAAAILLATIVILVWTLLLAGAVLNRLAKIDAKVDGLRRALAEIGGRTSPPPDVSADSDWTGFPPSPARPN
jgi:hypothetical protein